MKISLRLMLLTVAMMLFGFSARAGGINEEQAKAKAQSFLQSRRSAQGSKHLVRAATPPNLHSASIEEANLYVFNVGEQGGFIIVAGDDRARPILGYADSGSFDTKHLPDALNELLTLYAYQIERLGQTETKSDSTMRARRTMQRTSNVMADVNPLLSTTWNQVGPYNAYCPIQDEQTTLTGCVATAMAQIANYYKYPTSKVPSLESYISETNKINVSAWGATTFDWDNILDDYSGSYTSKQEEAIATLMRYCGQAAKMDYGFTSGAYNGDALYAFKNNLGYNMYADFKSAANYSANGWENLIYNEVANGRPVFYSALNGDIGCDVSGHAFVVDGYKSAGDYFHVNWGWGGYCDGYFNLFALDPDAPESPATTTGWHYQMLAIIGLSPETINVSKLTQDASGSYLITSADDWNELSAHLEDYSGGTFKLTNDISVTTMVGTEDIPFHGTFDGQGHVLNVNIESNTWGAAPFSYIYTGTAIKNLKIQGTVSCSDFHASGLIGSGMKDESFPVTITNCEVAVDVNGSSYAGGFIGHARYMQPTFTDCVFSGSINDCYNYGCFVGWKEYGSRPIYINCLSIPKAICGGNSYDFSHPGNDGSENHATLTNCYYSNTSVFDMTQGTAASSVDLANGSITHALQTGSREWTSGQVWGQLIGTDATPMLTSDTSKGVYRVSFTVDGQVVKNIVTNSPIGDKMPTGEDFGLNKATFTYNGASFNSTTDFDIDLTVKVEGTNAYSMTVGKPVNGSLSVNNNACMPGTLKKVTVIPSEGYVVSAIKVTDADNNLLHVTQVSNATNEYVFTFPKSNVKVDAEFIEGEAEATKFINCGLTLPSSYRDPNQHWTADTWTIWGDEYDGTDNVVVGTPPTDAMGHQWYEQGYELTNSDDNVQPNGNKIVWENHAASFSDGGNYDYFEACGANGDRLGDFYIRRIFTFNTQTIPSKLYLSCSYDDSPVEYYINGTLVYEDHKTESWHDGCFEVELTPDQIALIHTDGTPNVLAAHASQNWGGYHLDCGLYDPTAISYEVTGENTARVLANLFEGDVIIPETITYNGFTYSVTELADGTFRDCNGLTSVILPSTITSVGNNIFDNCDNLQYVKSYVPIYRNETLIAAPVDATVFELPMGYSSIYRNAFKYTENLTKLILPRSLSSIGENAFAGCKNLTEIYAYAKSVPSTAQNAFEGIDKSAITLHVYESALDSYKQAWGEDFTYITMPDPQPVTLAINVENSGSLRELIEEAVAEKETTIYDVMGITVTGNINYDDMRLLSEMCTDLYALTTINLGEASIEGNSIEYGMFEDRDKLTSIILPETLESIGYDAFYSCDGLTSIDIPVSVKRIRGYAFYGCSNLTTVTGMEGLSDANSYDAWDVFGGTAITQPVYGGSVFLYLPPSMIGEYEVPAGIKMTTAGSMRNSQLSSIILPASLTDLGDDTFMDCPNLVDIYCYAPVPPTCHSGVWEYGFDKAACTVHVPASVVEDYKNAEEWRDMGKIVGITSGELVDMNIHVATAGTLDDALFDAAVVDAEISDKVLVRNLTVTGSINADDVAYLNTLPNTLYNMQMLDLGDATLENNAITERMFYATSYKAIQLPATVTSIAGEAFREAKRLTSITLPESLQSIGSYAFANTALTSIVIPDGVTEMGDRVMQSCGALTSVTIGNGVTSIPDCWAEFCNNLEEVTIGKNVSSISWNAFYGGNIKNVYCYGKMPPSWDASFYDGINSDAVLHVYSNSVSRYENANGWKDFPTIVGDLGTYQTYDIAVNVETVGTFSDALHTAMTEAGCEDMTDISRLTVTGNVSHDDMYYLRDNVGPTLDALDLGEVTVEENRLGHEALRSCGFNEVVLPNSIEYLSDWSILSNCVNLKSINIPSSVKKIGPEFLYGATSLETVTGGDNVTEMDHGNGMYFDNCPNLKAPVILNTFFFRLPSDTEGAYEVPDYVTHIARDGMWHVTGLTSLTLPESIVRINGNAFAGDESLKDIYFYAVELPETDGEAFNDLDKPSCTLHVYEEMVDVFQNNENWADFNIVGDLGAIPVLTPMNEEDYVALCEIYNTLNGNSWTNKWIIDKNLQTSSRWTGVTFDEEGYVTSIDLRGNGLSGDISAMAFAGLTRLTNLNLSLNSITGDISTMIASLPTGCTLNVKEQDFGYIGEHTLYELCQYAGLPEIAYYNSNNGTFASSLIGVDGECRFYHEGTDGGHYWDCYICANGETYNKFKFYWQSPAIVECRYPHRFTFTYKYEMGDANMDDALDVLDLQTTLNYSNGEHWGLFNFYAADTYGQDDEINVQDIVATVNILLAQEDNTPAAAKALGLASTSAAEASVMVENGQLVLYTTYPVAALDLHLDGIEPESLTWNVEDMGFATATTAQGNSTHAIIYSLTPRQIKEGKTVLATFDASRNLRLTSATLSDSKAQTISVKHTVPTDITGTNGSVTSHWSITELSGVSIATGTNATETDILRLAKNRRLHGVFILDIDGAKRKIIIK